MEAIGRTTAAIAGREAHRFGYHPSAQLPHPWGTTATLLPLGLLAILAVAAVAISLLLARTQSVRDMATMHAVGATSSFLRRFTLIQAAVVLLAGLPLGMLAGLGLGFYQIAWNRRTGVGGVWLETVPLWGLQMVLVLAIVGVGLLTAWTEARDKSSTSKAKLLRATLCCPPILQSRGHQARSRLHISSLPVSRTACGTHGQQDKESTMVNLTDAC